MSQGPIEFLGEQAQEKLGDTEYGGGPGLIQSEFDPLGGDGHSLTPSEGRGVLTRAGNVPLVGEERITGELSDDNPLKGGVIDPVTGRRLEDDMNVDGSSAKLSDLKPK